MRKLFTIFLLVFISINFSIIAQTVYNGNGNSGFGGILGTGNFSINDDGTTATITFTKGSANFNDVVVVYIDSKSLGFSSTANFTDVGDGLRKAISGYDGTNRSTVNFPSGFLPDYAIAFAPSQTFGGLWELVENGSHTYINSVNLTPNNDATASSYTLSFNFADISAGGTLGFNFVATYVATSAYRSDEAIGGGITNGTAGWVTVTFSSYETYTSPLPVELTSFRGIAQNNTVNLTWSTATEVNNYGFEVQRASTSSTPRQEAWQKIAFVEGHGNSNSVKSYSYADNKVADGKYYYRLKQINSDGTFEYSETISAVVGIAEAYSLLQNYPNPFNPTTTIQFNLPENSVVSLKVFNALGQQVADLANGLFEAGIHKINFNASELNSGIYFYQIKTNDFTQVRKMMLVK